MNHPISVTRSSHSNYFRIHCYLLCATLKYLNFTSKQQHIFELQLFWHLHKTLAWPTEFPSWFPELFTSFGFLTPPWKIVRFDVSKCLSMTPNYSKISDKVFFVCHLNPFLYWDVQRSMTVHSLSLNYNLCIVNHNCKNHGSWQAIESEGTKKFEMWRKKNAAHQCWLGDEENFSLLMPVKALKQYFNIGNRLI